MDFLFSFFYFFLNKTTCNIYDLIMLYCALIGTIATIIGLFVISSKINLVSTNIRSISFVDNSINIEYVANSLFEKGDNGKREF